VSRRALGRGQIWWAELEPPLGSAPGYRRPVLVVQSDPFNASRIETIVVVALTTNLALAEAPGNVLLARKTAGVPRDCVINVSQVLTIDRALLGTRIGSLPPALLGAVDEGLRLVLGI